MSLFITIPDDLRSAAIFNKGGIGKAENAVFSFVDNILERHNINGNTNYNSFAIFPKGIYTVINEASSFQNSLKCLAEIPSIQIKGYFQKTLMTEFSNIFTWLQEGFTGGKEAVDKGIVGEIVTSALKDFEKEALEIIRALGANDGAGITRLAENIISGLDKDIEFNNKVKDGNYSAGLIRLPYIMAIKLLGTTPNAVYQLPYAPGKESLLFETDSSYGYSNGYSGNGIFQGKDDNPALKFLFGTMKIKLTPYFNPYSKGEETGRTFTISFDLYNDCKRNAENNLRFILTLIGNNMWVQHGIVQGPGSLYDVNIPGVQRLYMCTCNIKVAGKGITRNYMYMGRLILLPDVYNVTLEFKSLISNNFNSFIYDIYLNDITIDKSGVTINNKSSNNLIEAFIENLKKGLDDLKAGNKKADYVGTLYNVIGYDYGNDKIITGPLTNLTDGWPVADAIDIVITSFLSNLGLFLPGHRDKLKEKTFEYCIDKKHIDAYIESGGDTKNLMEIINYMLKEAYNDLFKADAFTLQKELPESRSNLTNEQVKSYSIALKSLEEYEKNKDNGGIKVIPPIVDSKTAHDVISIEPIETSAYKNFKELTNNINVKMNSLRCEQIYNNQTVPLDNNVKKTIQEWLTRDFVLNENKITPLKPSKDLNNYFISIFKDQTNKYTIIANGSNDSTDWQNICTIGMENVNLNSKFEFVKTVIDLLVKNSPNGVEFNLCGHGIGGTLVQHALLAINDPENKIKKCYSLNSLGFDSLWLTDINFKTIRDSNNKIINVRLQGDPISTIGIQLGNKYEIKYSEEQQIKDAISNNVSLIMNNHCYPNFGRILNNQ